MTGAEVVQNRAIASLLDVVEELVGGIAAGQRPDQEWADLVRETFDLHRRELATGEPEDDRADP